MKAPAGWRVTIGPGMLITEVLTAQQVYTWLTPPQRAALHTANGQPHVLARLRERGLLGDDNAPTEAGKLVIKWNSEGGGDG